MDSYSPIVEAFDKMIINFQSEAMEKFSLYSKGETCALHFLLEKGDYVLPREISEALQCSAARITKILTQLEQKGQIVREMDPDDRRKIKVILTEDGLERANKAREEVYKDLETIFAEMGEKDAREFMRTLKIFFDTANRVEAEK